MPRGSLTMINTPHFCWQSSAPFSFLSSRSRDAALVMSIRRARDGRYLERCEQLGTGPAGTFLQRPAWPTLNLAARLHPGPKPILSIAAALATASWLTCLDLSDNDLRATGTQSLCAALEVFICSAHALAAQIWADLPVRATDTPQRRYQQVPSSTSYSIATTWAPSKPSTHLSNGPIRPMQAGRHPDKMRGISETRQRR